MYWRGILNMGQEIGPFPHEVIASAQEIPGGPHPFRVDVSLGQQAAAQQDGDLVGVDLVVLRFTAVNRLHVEGVAEHELDAFVGTQIGKPVPGEDALDRNDEVFPKRRHGCQKRLRRRLHVLVQQDLAVAIQDAQIHGPGVQIDAAIVSMGLCVESH